MFAKLRTVLAAAAVVTIAGSVAAQEFISIGTGGVTGVYYPTGGAICRLVNKGRRDHGIRCSVEATGGSVYNINSIRSGDLEFGVAQSDAQFNALNGVSNFQDAGPFQSLRSVFSIHPEPFTVVARADAGITSFDDLRGKRVNIGNPGSGQRATMEVLMQAKGLTTDDFALVTELTAAEQSAALCSNQIDAIVYTVGHPSASVEEATVACDAVLVTVEGDAVNTLIAENSFYRKATIPGGLYRGADAETKTFGVGATFVTSENAPESIVYAVVKSIFENFDEFKRLHPAFANLTQQEMVTAGLSAPLHAGAAKYYREQGWID